MLYNLKNYDFLPIQSSEHTGFTRKGLLWKILFFYVCLFVISIVNNLSET
jgi:hypothetical protein